MLVVAYVHIYTIPLTNFLRIKGGGVESTPSPGPYGIKNSLVLIMHAPQLERDKDKDKDSE